MIFLSDEGRQEELVPLGGAQVKPCETQAEVGSDQRLLAYL